MAKIYDCIIIGAGPSGLNAGNVLAQTDTDFLIIEKGDYLYNRNPNIPSDIVSGVGGGGLFSDGKLSFYPSGSNIYTLNKNFVESAYTQLSKTLDLFGVKIPKLDYNWFSKTNTNKAATVTNKYYDSHVLSQENLYRLGFYLYDNVGKGRFRIGYDTKKIEKHGSVFYIHTEFNSKSYLFKCRSVIFAGGKFGAINLSNFIGEGHLTFKKFEFGIRIETDPINFDYNNYKQTDLKLLFKSEEYEGLEFRTFCFCRNGYIVHGKFEEIDTYNGVSNSHLSKMTNFGINLRISDEQTYQKIKPEIESLFKAGSIIKQKVSEFVDVRNVLWSKNLHSLFSSCIQTHFPNVYQSNAEVTGPSFEYFGYYPKLNNELQVGDHNFWVCGDATGDFRGLLPSLLSGHIAAESLIKKFDRDTKALHDLVRIKVSPTTKTKTVFTAQSKKFFYCKDVICEFVFREDCIPVNPFQVFGYFLSDRVDRSLVRKGNNELIGRCDELWIFGPIADGVLFEISRAFQLKIPIRFFTIGTFLRDIEEVTDYNKLVFEPEVFSKIGRENLIKFLSQQYLEETQLKLNF